jgi:hypothetical protein
MKNTATYLPSLKNH